MTFQLIILGVIILSFVVVIHELGHFSAARLRGIKVEELGIGFGKSITVKKLASGTKITLGIIPLGGFNKLCDERNQCIAGKRYKDASCWEKLFVILAGPTANILLAIFLLCISSTFFPGKIEMGPVVYAMSESALIDPGELKAGDHIVSVDGVSVDTWHDVLTNWLSKAGPHTITVRRNGSTVNSFPVTTRKEAISLRYPDQYGIGSHYSNLTNCVTTTIPGSPAQVLGIRPKDCLIQIGGVDTNSHIDVYLALSEWKDAPNLSIRVKREGEVEELNLKNINKKIEKEPFGVVMNMEAIYTKEQLSLIQSLSTASKTVAVYFAQIVGGVIKLITGEMPLKDLGSIYSVGKYGSVIAEMGVSEIAKYIAIISTSVAVFNLLPLYILDGGQALAITYTAVTKRAINSLTEQLFTKISLIVVIGLGFMAIYNDLLTI